MAGELVLLTGGTGFLGFAILVDLLKSGYRVRVAARSQAKIDKVRAAASIRTLNPLATQLMSHIVPDMTIPGAYNTAVQGVDYVIHAAAPLHAGSDGSVVTKEQLEEAFVTTSVNGSLGILKSVSRYGSTVKRIVMTSSTVAIAPPEVYTTGIDQGDIIHEPESRVAAAVPPYESELHAYCASKAAALNAVERYMKANTTAFDLISIMPSWIFGKDELISTVEEIRTGSTHVLINNLKTGNQAPAAVGNAVLNGDVARAHVKALDPEIRGNKSFVLNTEVHWEDTIPIARECFPKEFESGLFCDAAPQPTIPMKWDSSKVKDVLGIDLATYDEMIKEVVGQYLKFVRKEKD